MSEGELLQRWNKRWMILRRASLRSGVSVRLEKYESEAAASNQASSHCDVYDLAHVQAITRMTDTSKPGVYIILDDYSTLQFAADSSELQQSYYDYDHFAL